MRLTPNKILAGSAIILSVFALIAGSPFTSIHSYINPEQFADSIISKKQDLVIVDLRDKKDFEEYHIPSAINLNPDKIDYSSFNKSFIVVFYSARDNVSKSMQYKFEKEGFKNVYFLNGGIDDWMSKIIFPVLPKNASEEDKNNFEKIEKRSMYFGGRPEKEAAVKKAYRREGC